MPTGIEEAAVVTALISLGFQCLAGCVEGFELISTALRLGKHASYYRCAILLEENRLMLWARCSGLVDGRLDEKLNEQLINEVLTTLRELLRNADDLQKRYGLDVKFSPPPTNPHPPTYGSLSGDDFSFLEQETLKREREKVLKRAREIQKSAGIHKKFWFAAVDKNKFEELLKKISYLIDRLQDLLDEQRQATLSEELRQQRHQIVSLANGITQLQSLLQALDIRHMSGIPEASSARLKIITTIEQEPSDAGSTEDKLKQSLEQVPESSNNSLKPILSERLGTKRPVGKKPLRAVMTYDKELIYTEWKKYDWAAGSQETKARALDSIVNLGLLMNAPKHEQFRTLHCFGVLPDDRSQRYQLLYSWPTKHEAEVDAADPKSLLEYLSGSYKPSFTERVQLARELATSLFLLHTANWMHKAFASDNVLFFPASPAAPKSLQDPFVVGFEYSRQDLKDAPSEKLGRSPEEDIYRHPNCLGDDLVSFHKVYDIYAFGLVLFEIARWRPLKDIYLRITRERKLQELGKTEKSMKRDELKDLDRKLMEECQKGDIEHMRNTLIDAAHIDSHPVDVAFRTGSTYAEVVMSCLRGDFDVFVNDEDGGRKLQDAFYSKVLKKLDAIKV